MNTETKQFEGHTPGPWRVTEPQIEGSSKTFIFNNYHGAICELPAFYGSIKSEDGMNEVKANANLIAAAPELLKERDALKEKNSELADQVIKLMKERDAAVLERNISEAREARYSEALAKAKEPVS